ncbi:DUF4194 domain-containing protein [Kribbia dieselivorans]|uniref:DUF4194 domain-containing protein n=1 Tax=Kribbia dieselivorans TaxID=331526 RepID=UPI000837F853|nr:DUF4194 domain-containing protein [Kribbia dieselivorans]
MRTDEELAIGSAIIKMMRGVIYRESDEATWQALGRYGGPIRDHFATVGVDVVVDESEGYAFLRSEEVDDAEDGLPRLVHRRSQTYNVSVLLVLLRKQLAVFENEGGEGKLVLTRDQIVEMLRVFLPTTLSDAKAVDTVETTIRQTEKLGFLRQLRAQADRWEVRRIIKAYVDAQTLGDFEAKLTDYTRSQEGRDE